MVIGEGLVSFPFGNRNLLSSKSHQKRGGARKDPPFEGKNNNDSEKVVIYASRKEFDFRTGNIIRFI